ncbi:hypothetical protein [Gloeocapsopsis sp. IPPAS B-1203]|uniref:hypothetical protein n=1 Tax=Gloeocapsopsis sp. IPPAS B-1203 TaxID=2049454 RepID=UPI0025A30754|nr:hypothetical protein [Gloeocapsopsis sp. IPPAS B-1203]
MSTHSWATVNSVLLSIKIKGCLKYRSVNLCDYYNRASQKCSRFYRRNLIAQMKLIARKNIQLD